MLEHTKKPHTEAIELRAFVRADSFEAAKSAIAPFLAEGAVHWREEYPDFSPSCGLRGARIKEGLTQRDLAAQVGIPQRHISEMENGKRPIGKAMAKRFSDVLNIDYRVML